MAANSTRRLRLIGPSGHKSEYHCATLLGNWKEERTAFGLKDPAKEPLARDTTYRVSYKGTNTDEELFGAKPPSCFCAEAPKELLFYHGDITKPIRHQYTISELSYTSKDQTVPRKDILDKEGISLRRDHTNALRRTMGLGPKMDPTIDTNALLSDTFAASGKGVYAAPREYETECVSRTDSQVMASTQSGEYTPPYLPPIGRIQNKERFLTTKNVTLDVTGEYLKDNIDEYPLTSSKCWGNFMAYKDDPMQRTKLREEYDD